MSAPRRVVISNVFGSFNRGDALLVETLYEQLRSLLNPEDRVEGIAHFPELEEAHLPEVVWHRPPGRSYAANRRRRRVENVLYTLSGMAYAAAGAPRGLPWPSPPDQLSAIRALRDADLVVSCAGGFLLDANISIWGALLQMAIAHRFGRPIIVAPQTIGPIRSKWARAATKAILNRCCLIMAREGYTERFLLELGVDPAKIVRTTDLALFHQRVDEAAGRAALDELGIRSGERFLGASVVDWSFPGQPDRAAARRSYEDRLCAVLEAVHSRLGMRTLIVNQVSSDLALARSVAARLPHAVVLDEKDRAVAEMRGIIGQSDVFFGSRFHSCVFAMLERVPTLSIAYTYKSTGIMEDLGLAERVMDIADFAPEAAYAVLETMLRQRAELSADLDRRLSNLAWPSFAQAARAHVVELFTR